MRSRDTQNLKGERDQVNDMVDAASEMTRPTIQIGWVVLEGDGLENSNRLELAASELTNDLQNNLPDFSWEHELIKRRIAREQHQIDPLDLLKLGVQEKIERHWDFALVITKADLVARERPFIFGVPSSALETAVLSAARCEADSPGTIHLVQLARFLFASMLGLNPHREGAMRPPEQGRASELLSFSGEQLLAMRERLRDVGDERLEERKPNWNGAVFRLTTLVADLRGIARDVIGYRPWWQPFRLGRLTAAAFLSTLLSFLGAEVWELGVGISTAALVAGTAAAVLVATWFLYRGQNLSEVTRHGGMSEQVARTELILWSCLFLGMVTLWVLLCGSAYLIATVLPREVLERWISGSLDSEARLKFAAFVSTLGTLAGALGGNLEEEDAFKAQFFFDEEV